VALLENQLLVQKAAGLYYERITDALTNKMPCDLVLIKNFHREIKACAVEFYRAHALGASHDKCVARVLDKCRGIRMELEESNLSSFKESYYKVMGEIME